MTLALTLYVWLFLLARLVLHALTLPLSRDAKGKMAMADGAMKKITEFLQIHATLEFLSAL
jgi:hypothetical protein